MDKLGNMRRLEDQVNYNNTKTELFTQDIIKQAEEVELTNKTQLKELDQLSEMIKDLNMNY